MNLKPKELPFEQWARAKYEEIKKTIDICQDGKIDPIRLNEVLLNFSQNFAWAITIQEIELNKLNNQQHQDETWYKLCYAQANKQLKETSGGGRAPTQANVESTVVQLYGDEFRERAAKLNQQKSRVELLKGFVKVLDRQASILQTLSSNMRSELFFSGGVSIKGDKLTGNSEEAKSILRSAMSKQDKGQ